MNQSLTNTQAVTERIAGRIDPVTVSELALTNSAGGIDLENMSQVMELAKMMAVSDIAVRKHLRNNPGACLAVAIQAFEWKMTPFAVANKSYVVNDQIAYEAQLIQAVIQLRAPIRGRIKTEYIGEGQQRQIKVWATTTDDEVVDYLSPKLNDIKPQNSPLWKNDPDQQLHYFGVRSWCRRHFPEVILGVYARDELEDAAPLRDVTPPQASGLAARLGASKSEGGFNAAAVTSELGGDPSAETQDRPSTEVSVDWTNAKAATAAIKAGTMPEGYGRTVGGGLIVPDDEASHVEGHLVIMGLFREVRTVSGTWLKTKTPPAEEAADPEVMRDAASAALSNAERAAPEGMTEAQTNFWLAEYDRVLADAEANA